MKLLIRIISSIIALFHLSNTFSQENGWMVNLDIADTDVLAEIITTSKISISNYSNPEKIYPELSFFCEKNNSEISLKINWKRFISSFRNTEIGIKADNNEINWMKFNLDKSGEITYLKSSKKLNNLIDNLSNKKLLILEAEPYSEPSITIDFDITELKKYLKELNNLCNNWNITP